MKILAYPLRFLGNLMDRVFAVLGAVLLAQFPQYYGQYLQRLGGHLDELRLQAAEYEKAAAALGLSLDEFIEAHLQAGSEIFVSTGQTIVSLIERLARLEEACAVLLSASPFTRWWAFITHSDWSIAVQTWRAFTPGVPTTAEGLVYAAAGLLLGWGVFIVIKALAQSAFKRKRREPQA